MATFKINIRGQEAEINITRQGNNFHIVRDDHVYELVLKDQNDSFFVLEYEDDKGHRHLIRAAGASDGDQRQMWVNGQNFSYLRVRQRGSASALQGSLSSSIPAVVSKILINSGDQVHEGDKLILLESMKMVIPILSPTDGTVKSIHCSEGESVPAGKLLIELE